MDDSDGMGVQRGAGGTAPRDLIGFCPPQAPKNVQWGEQVGCACEASRAVIHVGVWQRLIHVGDGSRTCYEQISDREGAPTACEPKGRGEAGFSLPSRAIRSRQYDPNPRARHGAVGGDTGLSAEPRSSSPAAAPGSPMANAAASAKWYASGNSRTAQRRQQLSTRPTAARPWRAARPRRQRCRCGRSSLGINARPGTAPAPT